MTVRIIV